MRAGRRLPRLGLGLLLAGSAAVAPVTGPAPAAAGGERLPDLAMAPLSDFQIQWVNGRRLLRFTAMMVNSGPGHFELRGSRANTSQRMSMRQVIFDDGGGVAREVATNAVASYAGDGHNHWHVDEMMRYDMWGPSGTFRGAKVGFCFLDSDPWNTALPGARSAPFYRASMCSTNPSALSNRMGISVGWGDEYEWYLAWQWVDITSVAPGTYTVRAKVDPYGFFIEGNEGNQCSWARVSFGASSNAVSVHSRGSTCVNDIDGSIFAGDIAWAFANGITTGCAPDLFCTESRVTREQMASFLARALGLPAASRDFYSDDNASIHEGDINRVAQAGITTGCSATRFCPTLVVTREQMASFLARALELPAATRDHFSDDGSSLHQADINRVAEAGVTTGCGGSRYCPTEPVRRGQMAAFLRRAFS